MKARRNGLIEIARFVFAFFIVFYHNLFVVELPIFNNANYFVDFFFLLVGFFILKLFQKFEDGHPVESTFRLFLDRLKRIGVPFLLAYGCNLGICLLSDPIEIKMHYLWFIHIMLIFYILSYILYRLLRKNKKWFLIAMAIVFLISFAMRLCPMFYEYDELRGVSLISLGVLLSQVPRMDLGDEALTKKYAIMGVIIAAMLILAGVFISSLSLTHKKMVEFIADLLLFPSFIYLSLHIDFKSKITDILGLSSDFIYIYQSVCVFLICLNVTNRWITFAVLMALTIITTVVLRILEYKKQKSN